MAKLSKSLPKRATNTHQKEYRSGVWKRGQERKALRIKENQKRRDANVAAGKPPRVRLSKADPDSYRTCKRCNYRRILKGSVCWCQTIGAVAA